MLSKNDLKQIRTIIQEELKDALGVKLQYEKFNKEKGMKELIVKELYLSEWLVDIFPDLVGALRGMQTDTNKANNRMISTADNVKQLTEIMLQAENSLKCIASISDKIKQIPKEDIVQIESSN